MKRNEPAAEVAPVRHGKWRGRQFDFEDDYPTIEKSHYIKCSNCEHNHYLVVFDFFYNLYKTRVDYDDPGFIPNYCPNCGAKMDLE